MELVTQSDTDQIERPAEPWQYPYVAAVVDFGSNIKMNIRKDDEARVGYYIVPDIEFNHTNPAVIGFLDEFCREHGLNPRMRERPGNNYRLDVSRRDDIGDLLRLVEPYVIGRYDVVSILIEDLLPGLDNRLHSSEEGFVELMGYVDQIREQTASSKTPQYDQDYFRDKFGV